MQGNKDMKDYLEEQRGLRKHTRYIAVLSVFTASCLFFAHEANEEFRSVSFWSFLITALCAIYQVVRYVSQDAHFRTLQALANHGLIDDTKTDQEAEAAD